MTSRLEGYFVRYSVTCDSPVSQQRNIETTKSFNVAWMSTESSGPQTESKRPEEAAENAGYVILFGRKTAIYSVYTSLKKKTDCHFHT